MEKGEYLDKLDYEHESHSYKENQPQIQQSGLLQQFCLLPVKSELLFDQKSQCEIGHCACKQCENGGSNN